MTAKKQDEISWATPAINQEWLEAWMQWREEEVKQLYRSCGIPKELLNDQRGGTEARMREHRAGFRRSLPGLPLLQDQS